MLNENQLFVSYKDPDKPDEVLEGTEMAEFLMEYLKAHTEQDEDDSPSSVMSDEDMLVSPFKQASAISLFQMQKIVVHVSVIRFHGFVSCTHCL